MKKLRWLLIGVFGVLAITTWGCGDKSSDTPVGTGGTRSLRVRVVDWDNTRLQGAIVVLGDSTGAMIISGTTDTNGEITFTNSPANATVTASVPWNQNQDYYQISTLYDVNVRAVTLTVNGNTPAPAALGNVTVNVTNCAASVSYWFVSPAWGYGDCSIATSVTVSIYPSDIQGDGKVSFVVTGYDSIGNLVAYGTAVDRTFTPGMTVNISLNQTNFTALTYTLNNIPTSALYLDAFFDMERQDVWLSSDGTYTTAPIPTTVDLKAIPGIGTSFNYVAWLEFDQNNNGFGDSEYYWWKKSATLANQTVDYSTFPTVPSNLTITGATTTTPTLSWAGSDTSADEVQIYFSRAETKPSGSTYYYIYSAETPATRASVVFPELPESLADFGPTSIDGFDVYSVDVDVIDGYNGVNGILTKNDQYIAGGYPAEYSVKFSGRWYSTTQTFAPKSKPGTAGSKAKPTGMRRWRFR